VAAQQLRQHQAEVGEGGLATARAHEKIVVVMTMDPFPVAPAAPRSRPSSDRTQLALLSALAEAPDMDAAAGFLLSHIVAATGAHRACLLGFDSSEHDRTSVV